MEQFSKLSLDGATIGARMAEKKLKNLRKWVQSLCAPLRPFRSEIKENVYHSVLPHISLMYTRIKNISLARYRVPRKTVKFVPVVQKAHGRANVFAHRKSINPCNFKNCFGGIL